MHRPMHLLKAKGSQTICETCVNYYASLQQRWLTNTTLRTWWTQLSPSEKTARYQTQHRHIHRQKRTFEAVQYSEKVSKLVEERKFAVDALVPWRVFKRNKLAEGTTTDQASIDFLELLNDSSVHCEVHRGEWCVPVFEGIRLERGTVEGSGYALSRHATPQATRELGSLMNQGRILVDSYALELQKQASFGGAPLPIDIPSTDGLGEQNQLPAAVARNLICDAMQHEVFRAEKAFRPNCFRAP